MAGVVALMEVPPPKMNAVFRRNYDMLKDTICSAEQKENFFTARTGYYNGLLEADKLDNTQEHLDFLALLLERL